MGHMNKADWTVTFLVTDVLPYLYVSLSRAMNFVHWCACMVHIKFTARSIIPVVSSEIESMASDKALETSAQQGGGFDRGYFMA
jgi:hypothetical protein